ncbi:MAG: YceD family protein [Actinomycetota bacterium]
MPENSTLRRSQDRLDPRDPFVFPIRELGRRPGSMQPTKRDVPAPAGLALDLIGVPDGAPLVLDLRLESVTEGVLVTGTVTGPLAGECGRCLDPVRDDFGAEICELFAYPDSATDETTEQDEVYRIVDELIDLEPVVRDVVVLGLPMTPLCRPDCAGLCPTCGQRLDDLPGDHAHNVLDPRWAALASFAEPQSGAAHNTECQE